MNILKGKTESKLTKYEGPILFFFAVISGVSMILFKSGVAEVISLSFSFIILFLMFSIFLWNRKNNKAVLVGGTLLYVFLAIYWFGQI
jgi:hypothetical protein